MNIVRVWGDGGGVCTSYSGKPQEGRQVNISKSLEIKTPAFNRARQAPHVVKRSVVLMLLPWRAG
jgi:hypothetical protein